MVESKSNQSSTDRVISPKSLAHVVLRTSNFKPMVAFYKTFLGAHASHESDHLSFLTYDEEHHRVAILNIPGTSPKVPNSAGLHHMAFTFDTLQDLLLSYKQRKALGILPLWSVNHGVTMSCYYQDPDGNQIETQVDLLTADEANAFMETEEFAQNPVGVDFDPEEILARLESGEDESVLTKRVSIGPRGLHTVPQPSVPNVGAISV